MTVASYQVRYKLNFYDRKSLFYERNNVYTTSRWNRSLKTLCSNFTRSLFKLASLLYKTLFLSFSEKI